MENNNLLLILSLMFLMLYFYFLFSEYKKKGFKEKDYVGGKYEAFKYGAITGPWNTKYHWGTIVQIILLAAAIYLQVK